MKRLIIGLIALLSFAQAFTQDNDTTQYIYYRFTYGNRLDRYWANKVLMIPKDTIYSKDGLALKGGVLYTGNGTKWTSVASGSGAVDSFMFATRARVLQTIDSMKLVNDARYLQSVSTDQSIQGNGSSGSKVKLVGDNATPGNSKYYGTDGGGTKGYFTLPGGGSGDNLQQTTALGNTTNISIIDSGNLKALDTLHARTAVIHGPLYVGDSTYGAPTKRVITNGASVINGINGLPSNTLNGNIGIVCSLYNFIQESHAQNGTSTCQYDIHDSSTYSRIHETPMYDSATVAYFVFSTGDADTTTDPIFYKTQLGAIFDTLITNKHYPPNRILCLSPIWRVDPTRAALSYTYVALDSVVCLAKGVKFGNIFTPLQMNYPGDIDADSVHPSTTGHQIIARVTSHLMTEFSMVGNLTVDQNASIVKDLSVGGDQVTQGITTPVNGFQQAVNNQLIPVRSGFQTAVGDVGGFRFSCSATPGDIFNLAYTAHGAGRGDFKFDKEGLDRAIMYYNSVNGLTYFGAGVKIFGDAIPDEHKWLLTNGGNALNTVKIGLGVDNSFKLRMFGSDFTDWWSLGFLNQADTSTYTPLIKLHTNHSVGINTTTTPVATLEVGGSTQVDGAIKIKGDINTDPQRILLVTGGAVLPSTRIGMGVDAGYHLQIFGTDVIDRWSLGNISQADSTTYTPIINLFSADNRVGIGSTTDNATGKTQINSTTEQLALHYDASNYAQFLVNSGGSLAFEHLTGLTMPSAVLPNGSTSDSVIVESTSGDVATFKKVAQSSIGGGVTQTALDDSTAAVRAAMKHYADSVSQHKVDSLAGTITGGSSPPFDANTAILMDHSDNTKTLKFGLASITTGTVRTLTVPNTDLIIAGSNIANTWTGAQNMIGATVTVTTQSPGDNSTNASSTAYVDAAVAAGGHPIVFSQTSAGTALTNSTTPTIIDGTGVGSVTLAANSFFVGEVITCHLIALFSTDASPGNLSITLGFGPGAFAFTPPSSLHSQAIEITAYTTILTTGSGGTASTSYVVTPYGASTVISTNVNSSFNTTSSKSFGIQATWATASTNNSIQSMMPTTIKID